jgi:hypothetical protein
MRMLQARSGFLIVFVALLFSVMCYAHADEFQLQVAGQDTLPTAVEGCPGCCSSHGGITNSCASNGRVICRDGTVSPSCSCSSCGVSSQPPPDHTCGGGMFWNGSYCVCPAGEYLIDGYCGTPTHTCSGGQVWNGSTCACPSGQYLQGGVCRTIPACGGGQAWNGSACVCPHGEVLTGGTCARPQSFSIVPGITGTWISADHDKESGFGLELLAGNMLLVEWYAFGPNGGQAYVGGVGPVGGNTAVVDLYQVTGPGAVFPPNFDSEHATSTIWGYVTIEFDDCNHGRISWVSSVAGFGRGQMEIVRLTQPVGLTCP